MFHLPPYETIQMDVSNSLRGMLHEHALWCTLTYSLENEPRSYFNKDTGQIFDAPDGCRGTLSPYDLDLFLKRLRKSLPPRSIRYFAVGEYGGTSGQPHYHLFLFGLDPSNFHLVRDAWVCPRRGKLGLVRLDCNNVNASGGILHMAQYTAGYTVKKMVDDPFNAPRLRGRYKEFTSHSLGIGRAAVPRICEALGGADGLSYIKTFQDVPRVMKYNGRNVVIDRYFREKILEHLGITNELKAFGLQRYKKEMSALSLRAALNPKFISSATISPLILEKQHKLENAQRVLNITTRAKLLPKKEKL